VIEARTPAVGGVQLSRVFVAKQNFYYKYEKYTPLRHANFGSFGLVNYLFIY